jgi:hypothetical protein
MIAIDGERSCAGVGRRDRFVTNAIARRRPPRRSLLLAGPRAAHDRKGDNSIAGSAVFVADRGADVEGRTVQVHKYASPSLCGARWAPATAEAHSAVIRSRAELSDRSMFRRSRRRLVVSLFAPRRKRRWPTLSADGRRD